MHVQNGVILETAVQKSSREVSCQLWRIVREMGTNKNENETLRYENDNEEDV